MATQADFKRRKLRDSVVTMLNQKKDPSFIRYAHWRSGFDLDEIDNELKDFNMIKNNRPSISQGIAETGDYNQQLAGMQPKSIADVKALQEMEAKEKENLSIKQSGLADMQDKLNSLQSVLQDTEGLKSAVGTNFLGRLPSVFTGDRERFIGAVENIISKDTLQQLIDAKARGATFGALSEGELRLLQSSASKIGRWAVRDKDGNIIGYNVNEKDFQKELNSLLEQTKNAQAKMAMDVMGVQPQGQINQQVQPQQPTQPQYSVEGAIAWAEDNPKNPKAKQILEANKKGTLQSIIARNNQPVQATPTTQDTPYGLSEQGLQKWANENPEAFDKWADRQGYTSDPAKKEELKKGGLIDDLSQRVFNIIDVIKQGSERQKGASIFDTVLNVQRTQLRGVGEVAGAVGDVATRALEFVYDKTVPDETKEAIKQKASEFMATPQGQSALGVLQQGTEAWGKFKESNPEVAKDLEASFNILTAIPAGKGLGYVGKSVKPLGKEAVMVGKEAGKSVGKAVAKKTENVVGKVTDTITPIEPGVKTYLSKPETKVDKLNKYVRQAEESVSDYSKPTPLELAGREAENAVVRLSNKLNSLGKSKKSITEKISDINVGNIAVEARDELQKEIADRLGTILTSKGFKNAKGRVSSLSDVSDAKMIKQIDDKLSKLGKSPTFRMIDDTVDYIQDVLYKRSSNLAVPVNTKVEGVLKKVASNLNNKLKELKTGDISIDKMIEKYKEANDSFSNIVGTRNDLNKLLGEKGKRGGALMKRVFSPSDAGTKKLFAKVKELTGIDLVDEATLAKFVMENIGDARQASLLEEAIKGNITGAKSFIAGAANKVIKKLQNPVGKARRIIEKKNK